MSDGVSTHARIVETVFDDDGSDGSGCYAHYWGPYYGGNGSQSRTRTTTTAVVPTSVACRRRLCGPRRKPRPNAIRAISDGIITRRNGRRTRTRYYEDDIENEEADEEERTTEQEQKEIEQEETERNRYYRSSSSNNNNNNDTPLSKRREF